MNNLVMGVDECGCSSLFGPVTACAVVIDESQKKIAGSSDSKGITRHQRNNRVNRLKEDVLCYGVGSAGIQEIKKLNIYWAKLLAMKRACQQVISKGFTPNEIFIDGNAKIPNFDYKQTTVVKGDQKIWFIGAASIIGKVTRDDLLEDLANNIKEYSYYDLENNAGYFTKNHLYGIIKQGLSDLHRKEFIYSQFCNSLHKEYMYENLGLGRVENWLSCKYGKKVDLDNDWALYRYWKTKKDLKLKKMGWD